MRLLGLTGIVLNLMIRFIGTSNGQGVTTKYQVVLNDLENYTTWDHFITKQFVSTDDSTEAHSSLGNVEASTLPSTYTASSNNITNSTEHTDEVFLNTVGLIRWLYLPVVGLGTVTNIMNMVVFSTTPMRRLTTTVYLAALAGGDVLNLYAELFRYWVEWMDWLIPPETYFSDAYCKFANYMATTSRDLTNWLVAVVTIERAVVLALPFRAKTVCTLPRARLIVVCLLVLVLLAHVPILVVTVAVHDVAWVCWGQDGPPAVQVMMTITFYAISNSVIVLVFVLNITLVGLLYRARRPLARLSSVATTNNATNNQATSTTTANTSRPDSTRKLSVMLLSIGIMFIICEMPRLVIILLYTRQVDGGNSQNLRIAMSVSFLLSGINHTANFFIYVLSGRRFRHVFMNTFHCCTKHGGQRGGPVRSVSLTKLQTFRPTTTGCNNTLNNKSTGNLTPRRNNATCSIDTMDSTCSRQTRVTTISSGAIT